eukprot:s4606_g3.t1
MSVNWEDWRDPNTAWTGWDKTLFLFVYALFWATICLIVRFWPHISRAWSTVRRHFFSQRVVRPIGDTASPLVEASQLCGSVDLAVGPKPQYPSDRTLLPALGQASSFTPIDQLGDDYK